MRILLLFLQGLIMLEINLYSPINKPSNGNFSVRYCGFKADFCMQSHDECNEKHRFYGPNTCILYHLYIICIAMIISNTFL